MDAHVIDPCQTRCPKAVVKIEQRDSDGASMPLLKLLGLGAVVTFAGCMMDLDERASASNGEQFFASNCAGCHSSDARGYGGPLQDLMPAPDLTLLAQRNGGVFPEIEILSTVYGPAFHRDRGTVMPEFGRRDLGPMVIVELEEGIGTPIPADLIALSEYLRSIQR